MKQTEIGLIPDDWEVKTLNGIGRFIGGGTPNTNNANYWKGNIPWISSSDISKDSINTLIPTRFITKEAVSCSATKLCPKNTILIVSRVGVGKLAISNTEVCTSQDFTNLVCDDNVDESFVAYQLLPKLQHKASEAQGTSIKGITTEEVRALQIPFPSYEEQQRIAKALADVDALISTAEKLIQKKKNIKQGTMQNLLTGKKRLPGFGPQTKFPAYKQTELGPIPEDWEVKSLGDVAIIIGGGTPSTTVAEYWNGNIEWFTPAELSESQKYVSNSLRTITVSGLQNSSAKLLPAGTILLTTRATIGIAAITKKEVCTNQGFQSLIVRNNCDNEFLYYVIPLLKEEMLSRANGSTFTEISSKKLSNIQFAFPSKEEQIAIANVLSSMDKEIETLNTKLEKYRNLKTAIMQQLLTGKIRL